MKADPTLVSAAFRLGQSYVPADYSTIFNKQYEGIIAAYNAKYKAKGDVFQAFTEAAVKVGTAVAAQRRKQSDIDAEVT